MLVEVVKRRSMLNKQNSKCLPNNDCPFGRGFRIDSMDTFHGGVIVKLVRSRLIGNLIYHVSVINTQKNHLNSIYDGDNIIFLTNEQDALQTLLM